MVMGWLDVTRVGFDYYVHGGGGLPLNGSCSHDVLLTSEYVSSVY